MEKIFCLLAVCVLGISSLQVKDYLPKKYKLDTETLKYQLKFLLLFKNKCPPEDKNFLTTFKPEMDIHSDSELVAQLANHDWLKNGELFSVYNEQHLEQAILLFKVFYHAKTVDDLYKVAIWMQTFINERMWSYSLSVALVHRPDTFGIIIPPAYELSPHLFFNSELLNSAQEGRLQGCTSDPQTVRAIMLIDNHLDRYTNLDSEQLLTYFTEDVGLNLFYYLYHIFYPWWMDGKEFGLAADHRGELFYYVMAQLVARYNLERRSVGLDEVPPIDFTSPLDFGYYPSLRYSNGVEFPSRPEGVCLKDVRRNRNGNLTNAYTRLRDFAFRIQNVIDLGRAYSGVNIYKNDTDGLEILSNLLEGNPNSPELPYYGTLQIYARHLLGYAPEPLNRHKAIPAATEHYETTLRDPASWRFFKWLLNFYDDFYKRTKPYTKADLEYPGVQIGSFTADDVNTYFDSVLSDVGSYYSTLTGEDVSITIRQKRLNHQSWTYNISVSSDREQGALVKVFIGPKFDRYGQELDIHDVRDQFYIIDHFSYNLVKGHNEIVRTPYGSMGADRTSVDYLIHLVSDALKYGDEFVIDGSEGYWSFPQRLLLPRGTKSGMTFQLYVILTPLPDIDKTTTQDAMYKRVGTGRHSTLTFRFPLDKRTEDLLLVPNSFITDITIYHKEYN